MSRIFEALQQSRSEVPAEPETIATAPRLQGPLRDVNGVVGLDQVSSFPIKTPPEYRLVAVSNEQSLGAEKIRVLSARLRALQQRRQLKKILITSCLSEEGKSVVAVNLALTLAMRGHKKTLLINGDLRRPSVAKLLGITETPGLTDWWRTGESVRDFLRRAEGLPLWLLPAGSGVEQPLEVLQSERFSQLLVEVGEWFDWIIVDSAPLSLMADSGVWIHLVDGVVMVVKAGRTPQKVLQKTVDSIDKAKLLGFVLNEVAQARQHYYHYYKKYQDTRYSGNGHKTQNPLLSHLAQESTEGKPTVP